MFVIMWAETYAVLKAALATAEEKVRGLEEQIIMVQDSLTGAEKRADQAAMRADNAVDRLLVKRADAEPITPVPQGDMQPDFDPFTEDPLEVSRIVDAMKLFDPQIMAEGGAR